MVQTLFQTNSEEFLKILNFLFHVKHTCMFSQRTPFWGIPHPLKFVSRETKKSPGPCDAGD
jgi:hypothetical protein